MTEAPPSEQLYQSAPSEEPISAIKAVEKVTVWVMVFSAIFFALISILAVWGMFSDSGEIVGRSLSTIAIIAVTALIINVGATMLESKKNKDEITSQDAATKNAGNDQIAPAFVILIIASFFFFPPLALVLLLWLALGKRDTHPALARLAAVLLIALILGGVMIYLYMSNVLGGNGLY